MSLPTIGMFWDGPPLGFIERLCVTSFVKIGHPVVIFSYNDIGGVPQGVELASASDILQEPKQIVRHGRTGSPAIYADKFRYHLLAKNDGIVWSDTDAYCLRPFVPKDGYFFGRENEKIVANGVMALPAESQTLRNLIDFCEDEYAIPSWMMPKHIAEMKIRSSAGDPMHVSEMPWGAWGPKALTYYLKKNDEFHHALAPHVLYPVPFEDRRIYFRAAWKTWKLVQDDTVSIHFYGRRVRERLKNRFLSIPPKDSILFELAEKNGVQHDGL
ncbi:MULTISPECIES: hypothetical protein [Halocynthiibacter]|uniref:Alpha 1,4-glycosyltransferase domain-containing protein n=1 Tax=Halocynthiibacter halioticoli TaxID=2986804 RepID=A0AAE3LQB0_9RHOB|nr:MULTISPECIES: hypothetical protein [Halocynthiibacter]MCV6824277.1 hypothetical protein [Halocynthiibacter halioticoli]MCW4057278.1 hypothetical protein [Halocynthiibacter sp. SDUM655004]